MSEPVSAFAAYQANKNTKQKQKQKQNNSKGNKNKNGNKNGEVADINNQLEQEEEVNNSPRASTSRQALENDENSNKAGGKANKKSNGQIQTNGVNGVQTGTNGPEGSNKNKPKTSTQKRKSNVEPSSSSVTVSVTASDSVEKNAKKKNVGNGFKDEDDKVSSSGHQTGKKVKKTFEKVGNSSLTSSELKLLSLDPLTLSKKDRKRRAAIEAKYKLLLESESEQDHSDAEEASDAEDDEGSDENDFDGEFEEIDMEELGIDEDIESESSDEDDDDEDEEEEEDFNEDSDADSGADSDLTEYSLNADSDDNLGLEPPRELLEAMGREVPGQKRKTPPPASPQPDHLANDDGPAPSKQARSENSSAKTPNKNSAANSDKFVKEVFTRIKLEPLSPPPREVKTSSIDDGKKAFQWLLSPLRVDDFFDKYWEQSVCIIKRTQREYFKHLISFEKIGKILLNHHLEFTKNVDITKYKNGKRETLNPEGRAFPPVVWDFYQRGCSVRLLNPQTFIPEIHSFCARLQEFFSCMVGVNAYLTPAGTQGFAPHYDDIEAFVLQIEGEKKWRLYKPRQSSEFLPRVSSKNFKQSEIGEPIFEQVLRPGDLLYFPRGIIHQASSEPDRHSLHLTISVYQKHSYADVLEKMVPLMLDRAIRNSVDFRKGLPLDFFRNLGLAFSDTDSEERAKYQQQLTTMVKRMITSLPMDFIIDQAVDQLAKKFQHEALPPEIQNHEKDRTIYGSKSSTDEAGVWNCDYDINLRTNIRLLRANIVRLVEEENEIRIYYYSDNSKEYCEFEPNFIEIDRREAACIETLIRSYPAYIGVSQLPLKSSEKKISVATALWERGLLMMEKPFKDK